MLRQVQVQGGIPVSVRIKPSDGDQDQTQSSEPHTYTGQRTWGRHKFISQSWMLRPLRSPAALTAASCLTPYRDVKGKSRTPLGTRVK